MPLKKDKPVRVIFMDLDRTLIEPIPFPKLRVLNREAIHSIGNTLDKLHDRHNYIVVIVTNKPAGRVHDIAHTILGRSAWNWHFAESGAVCVDLASYSHALHESYKNSAWVTTDRPQLIAHLRRDGLTQFEAGDQMVNVILVNPKIADGEQAQDFMARVQESVESFSRSYRVIVSHGEGGNLADLSPKGYDKLYTYGKHLAAEWAHSMLVDWTNEHSFELDWEHSYVFGDSDSDAVFLDTIRKVTGIEVVGACPSNASDVMLDRCGVRSSLRVEEGTAKNLDTVLKSIKETDAYRSINAMRAT